MPARKVVRRRVKGETTVPAVGSSVAAPEASAVSVPDVQTAPIPATVRVFRAKLPEMEGGEIAELLVRLLVRLTNSDMHCLVMDAMIYLAQEGPILSRVILSVFGAEPGGPTKHYNSILADLTRQRLLERVGERSYQINYLWIFYMAEKKYLEVMKAVAAKPGEALTEYVCTRCRAVVQGKFAVFDLERSGDDIFCKKPGCSGKVIERNVEEVHARAHLREACGEQLAAIKAILDFQHNLYIPKETTRLISSGDILSHQQYKNFQEQNALSSYSSHVMQMDTSKKGLDIQFSAETLEERTRREYEEAKVRQRQAAVHGLPWLTKRNKRKAETTEEPTLAPFAPAKKKKVVSLGEAVLRKGDGKVRSLSAYPVAFYVSDKVHLPPEEDTNDAFVNLSEYYVDRALRRVQEKKE